MISIPLGAKVHCLDQSCGESIAVLVDPANQKVTHMVLQDNSLTPEHTRVVPVEQIKSSSPKEINLECDRSTLAGLNPFQETITTPVERPLPPGGAAAGTITSIPTTETVAVESRHEAIPDGEIVLHRGSRVEAVDGTVGQVDAVVVRPENGEIRDLVVEEGFFWNKKVVKLPRQAIDHMADDTVILNVDKQAVGALPQTPLRQYQDNPSSFDGEEERTDPSKTDPQAYEANNTNMGTTPRTGADYQSSASSQQDDGDQPVIKEDQSNVSSTSSFDDSGSREDDDTESRAGGHGL